MPVIVYTKNTTPVHSPFGAADVISRDIEDIQIQQANPNYNFYIEPGSLGASPAESIFQFIRAPLMHQIPSNAINVQARFYGYTGGGFGSFTTSARRMTKLWLPLGADWFDQTVDLLWQSAGGQGALDRDSVESTQVISAADTWYSWVLDAMTAYMIANPYENEGVGLYPDVGVGGFRFMHKSNGTDGFRNEWWVYYELPPVVPGGVSSFELVRPNPYRPVIRELIVNNLGGGGGGGPNPVPTVQENYIMVFGHSLFLHTLFLANGFTNSGFTMGDISRQSLNKMAIKQIFNQLRDQTIPPNQVAQQYFTPNQGDPWPASPVSDFTLRGWTDFIVMASNFEQTSKTPSQFVDESEPVLDYLLLNVPAARRIVYEHWARPSQYGYVTPGGNTMSVGDWDDYKNDHRLGGQYHNWHLDYQDEFNARGYGVSMIPIGPIIFDALQTEPYLTGFLYGDLFVDEAGHGNANCYFMAGLICYIAMVGEPDPNYYPLQESFLHSALTSNLSSLISFITARLAFHGANGVVLPS